MNHLTAADVRAALRSRFCQPEWALFFEVADGNYSRRADGVAMNMWPSRGLAILGFEIKVHRRDWLNELKNPAKADAIARFCDQWWIAAAPDVVKPEELPANWGLFEVHDKGLRQIVPAKQMAAVQVAKEFVAALLRRVGKGDEDEINAVVAARLDVCERHLRKRMESEARSEQSSLEYHEKKLAAKLAEIKERCGVDLEKWRPDGDTAEAIRMVLNSDLLTIRNVVQRAKDKLSVAVANIGAALEGLDPPGPFLPREPMKGRPATEDREGVSQ